MDISDEQASSGTDERKRSTTERCSSCWQSRKAAGRASKRKRASGALAQEPGTLLEDNQRAKGKKASSALAQEPGIHGGSKLGAVVRILDLLTGIDYLRATRTAHTIEAQAIGLKSMVGSKAMAFGSNHMAADRSREIMAPADSSDPRYPKGINQKEVTKERR